MSQHQQHRGPYVHQQTSTLSVSTPSVSGGPMDRRRRSSVTAGYYGKQQQHAAEDTTSSADRPSFQGRQVPEFLTHVPRCYLLEGEHPLGERGRPSSVHFHPAVVRTGILMQHRRINGGNSRAVAMLNAFVRLLEDYTPMPFKSLKKHLEAVLSQHFNFLTGCRPHNVAMGNTMTILKSQLQRHDDLSSDDYIQSLISFAGHFVNERIVTATWTIAMFTAQHLIRNRDHVLVYGHSSAVRLAVGAATKKFNKQLRVTVVDASPREESRRLAEELEQDGVEVTYTLLNSIGSFIPDCRMVLLGASGILSDGSVLTHSGAASVAALATARNKLVYVLGESYKVTTRTTTNGLSQALLDDPRLLFPTLRGEESDSFCTKINTLNLVYDVVDAEFIKGLVTEDGYTSSEDLPRACANVLQRNTA
eukprot:Lankesteria_metandrocarpae@DN1904_c0_g1_i1.p1